MTKKTRIRVARLAAGAVIAAGASLTAAGAASATDIDLGIVGVNVTLGDPTDPPTDIPEPPTDPEDPPTEPEDPPTEPEEPPTEPEEPPTEPEEPPTDPTDPSDPPTDPTDPSDPPAGDPSEPSDPSAPSPNTPGENGGGAPGGNGSDDEGAGTCTVDLDGAECADNTGTDNAGSKPVEQSVGKEELAETGAGDTTTFLLIGAATMIAGGIGFRMLPRLVGGGRTAA
ncbi:hypothetical protein GCM10009654_32480 [Streptomyces hebeiensis]|uniref:Gram-positive cocci surface proteins LPxTG domain-containing protein n=1 Tax=Streptomyces hebeiensis TaxID=229486 RepID=A0ABN1UX72_9ACTN